MKPTDYNVMSELSVYMSEADLERIVVDLIAAGCVLVPDVPSDEPVAHEIHSLQAFLLWRRERRATLFFAVSGKWSVAPFEWGKYEKNGVTKYFVRQKTGGPTLDIFAPYPLENPDGKATLPHGFLAYHSTYWNTLTNRTEKPPAELKSLHKLLVQKLRLEGEQLRSNHRTYLVAKGAKDKLRSGCLLGPPLGSTPPP